MSNTQRARHLLDEIYAVGVRTILSCAGARNSPLVALLQQDTRFNNLDFFDERSAGFFALGRAKATHSPVAVCTTSGTAVAELFPSIIEAHYSAIPLLLLTADRPPSYRGSGAPQSIEQSGIFGSYVECCEDLKEDETIQIGSWSRNRPWHINICFGEPLFDDANSSPSHSIKSQADETEKDRPLRLPSFEQLDEFLGRVTRPLVVIGELSPKEAAGVGEWVKKLGATVYAEGLSQLRGSSELEGLTVRSGENLLKQACAQGQIDSILRIGGVPTCRLWRDLDTSLTNLPVLSLSVRPFSGLNRGLLLHLPTGEGILREHCPKELTNPQLPQLMETDRRKQAQIEQLLLDYPKAEPSLVRSLSKRLSQGTFVYLGNSMPIREWDLAVHQTAHLAHIAGNRGANGIDGQISSFLGMAAPGRDNIAILGDLTTLYDLSSPWALRHLETTSITIVVINNGGGRIFDRLFGHDKFRNAHDVRFDGWAKQWQMDYESWDSVPERKPIGGRKLIEIHPRETQTQGFWDAYAQLWQP